MTIRSLRDDGQAMAEMLLVVPLLFLMAAGLIQFTQLFLARVAFENACGRAMREWCADHAAGVSVEQSIWVTLGEDRRFFIPGSIRVETRMIVAHDAALLSIGGNTFQLLTGWVRGLVLDYEGARWTVHARCLPTPLLSRIFRDGIPCTTRLAAMRYPINRRILR
jgi:hypothetical protein